MIYSAKLDGTILKYRAAGWGKLLIALFELNHKVELPINLILSYSIKKRWYGVTTVKLIMDKYRMGNDAPNPIHLPPMLFLNGVGSFVKELHESLDKNIQNTIVGKNVGLCHLHSKKVLDYYQRIHDIRKSKKRSVLSRIFNGKVLSSSVLQNRMDELKDYPVAME